MKNKFHPNLVKVLLLGLVSLNASRFSAQAQGTAFTYQGKLNNGTAPVTGLFDFQFSLYTAASGGSQVGSTVSSLGVGVTNGLFTTTLDFGSVFASAPGWLSIGVRTNGAASFSPLNPLQALTPTPYAISAETVTGVVPLADLPSPLNQLSDPGTFNFFAGQSSGNSLVSGSSDVSLGAASLNQLTSGSYNSGLGYGSLEFDTTGNYNAGMGTYALQWVTTGSYNTASGVYALSAEPTYLTGSFNTADGAMAGYNLGAGSNNVAIGYQALYSAPSDNGVVAIGFQALQSDVGSGGFFSISSGNVAVGYQALQKNTTGSDNMAIGLQSLTQNIVGNNNTASGTWSLLSNNGNNNTADGAYSLLDNTSGYQNTASGASAAGANSSGHDNTADGNSALVNNTTGSFNTAVGSGAMNGQSGESGTGNTASGAASLANLSDGYNNVAVGFQALFTNTVGFDNVSIGAATIQVNGLGHQNTAVGTYSFQNMTSGSGNVGLGYYAGNSLISGNNNIYIGNSGAANDNNVIRIGSGQSTNFIAGTTVDMSGSFMIVEGAGGVRCYMGDDGSGNDVQLGSLKHGATAVALYNNTDSAYMHLYCSSITIEGGADLAEPFSITKAEQPVGEGEVVVIDDANPGQLKLTDQPYDTRVAGVVSGANGINPGIQMHQQGLMEGGKNVALTGRVYVQADTSNGAIKPGDLLTTSSTPGRAMRVSDHARAQGAILGKAMTALKSGHGMVLVLVTLQ